MKKHKDGRINKMPLRSGFGKVSFFLMDGSEGLFYCRGACKDNSKWRALQKIKTWVLRSKEITMGKIKSCLDLINIEQC